MDPKTPAQGVVLAQGPGTIGVEFTLLNATHWSNTHLILQQLVQIFIYTVNGSRCH